LECRSHLDSGSAPLITAVNVLDMDTPFVYEIRVEGHLSDHWSAWFDGLKVQAEPNGEARLTGLLSDQAALYGVLAKIHNLNLVLVSVVRLSSNEDKTEN